MVRKNIVFILTHPIQYYSPLFKYISEADNFNCEVWYLSDHGITGDFDRQFGVNVKWDIPLLEGYKYRFLRNNSWRPGIYGGFWGLMNFEIIKRLGELPKRSIVVIHSWNVFSNIIAIVTAKIMGHIVCLRCESPLKQEIQKGKIKLLVRKLILGMGLFNCVNKFLYIGQQNKLFYQFYGVKEDKLIFTPYAVNNDYFNQQSIEWMEMRKFIKEQLGIPFESNIILYSGKLIRKKNPVDLLNAFSRLKLKSKCFLIFMGDGELRQEMENLIMDEELTNVLITGFVNQSEISRYYSIADLYVMCSGVGETWGLSTNEAMNFGLPVLLSDMTGCADDLVKENGLVFRTNDTNDLLNRLTDMVNMSNKDLKIMGDKSKIIVKGYSYDIIEEGLRHIS